MHKSHDQCIEQTTGITPCVNSQRGCKPIIDDFGSNSNFEKQEFIAAKISISKNTLKREAGNLHSNARLHRAKLARLRYYLVVHSTQFRTPPNQVRESIPHSYPFNYLTTKFVFP
jgi:hypothetical protein